MIRFYLFTLVPVSVLLPIGAGVIFYYRLHTSVKILWIYTLVSGGCNLLGILLAQNRINNMPLFHIYTVVECSLCLWFFSTQFGSQRFRYFLNMLIPLFMLFCGLNAVLWQSIWEFNTYTRSVEAFLLIIASCYYLYQTLQIKSGTPSFPSPGLWFCLGILFYFSGSLFLFIFRETIRNLPDTEKIGWMLHASLVLVMNLLFTLGFIRHKSNV